MALVKPIVNTIPAFDATEAKTISFVANGGDQVVKNEIKIVVNNGSETETIAYQNTITTYALSQTVPANCLTNGTYYKVAFRTYDSLNNTSAWSDYEPFYCFTNPTLTFNISDGQTVYAQSFNLTMTYRQIQNEKLDYATINVYDSENRLIESSGNLYDTNTPPIAFTLLLANLVNNATYRIVGTATTIYNTIVTSQVTFTASYEIIEESGELYADVNGCDGYVNIKSAPIINGDMGEVEYYPENLEYVEHNTMLSLINPVTTLSYPYSSYVKWYGFSSVQNRFLLRMWFYPARTAFDILTLSNASETVKLTVKYERGSTQDYLCIRTTDGTVVDQGLGTFCNGNTRVFLWIKVVGATWEVRTDILANPSTVLSWNNTTNNNIKLNVTTNITYRDEAYGTYSPSVSSYTAMSSELNALTICNGIFDHLNVSLNINTPYSTEIPTEDRSAVITVQFNGTVENATTGNFTKMVLRRKDVDTLTWLDLQEIEIPSNSERQADFNDRFIPSGETQTYSLVLYEGNTPSESYVIDVLPKWGRVFLSDKDEDYKLNYAVIYSGHVQNVQNGVLMPIGSTYPIVIANANGNYRSGSLQFKVLGYQFEIDKTLDRESIVKQTNDIIKFLTNKKAKCIKDYNGNIFICKVINSPQISYDANWGNGITTISFDWVEQCKYNDYDTMSQFGLL